MKVYLIENTRNGKGYVGITTQPVSERWKQHVHSSRSAKTLFARAIRKYGTDNFKMKTLEVCQDEISLRQQEIYWIEKLGTFMRQGGYNMTLGGDGLFGYQHTDEAKAAMSRARMGDKNHNYGKVWGKVEWTDEERAEQSRKKTGKPLGPHTDEARAKISEALRKRVRKLTPVVQCDLSGKEIQRFESAQLAAKSLGTSGHNHILCVCRNQKGTYRGFTWQYAKSVSGER